MVARAASLLNYGQKDDFEVPKCNKRRKMSQRCLLGGSKREERKRERERGGGGEIDR